MKGNILSRNLPDVIAHYFLEKFSRSGKLVDLAVDKEFFIDPHYLFVIGNALLLSLHAHFVAWCSVYLLCAFKFYFVGLKQSPAVERMQETVKPIADRVRAGDKSAREELTAKLRELTTSLSPSGLAAIFKAAQPDAESLAELTHMFDTARQSSIGDGWAVVEEEQSASPMPMQKIVLEKGNESRRLVMIATAGPGAVVFLSQQPKAAAD